MYIFDIRATEASFAERGGIDPQLVDHAEVPLRCFFAWLKVVTRRTRRLFYVAVAATIHVPVKRGTHSKHMSFIANKQLTIAAAHAGCFVSARGRSRLVV